MVAAAVFILCAVVHASLSTPIDWDYPNTRKSMQCADHCTASNKFQYEAGKTYEYDYEATTETDIHGASDDLAKIYVSCKANIHVISKCEMVLELSNVDIKSSSPDTSGMTSVADWPFKRALTDNALRFSFQDGLIEDLCPSAPEETRSLNFKRAVLSAFQNSMTQHVHEESIREIDVVGECPTDYSIHQKGWKSTQFSKVKDLLGCSDRYHFTTALQATPFRAPDAIQSLPLLKGDHRCTQTVSKNGHVTSTQCIESLVFRPFSKKEAGARTHTVQTMTYIKTKRERRDLTDDMRIMQSGRRTNLLFGHDMKPTGDDQTLFATREKLAEICRITVDDIPTVVPSLFTDMVYLMRRLTGSEFMAIAEGVHRGNICNNNKSRAKKFFYDALPMVGTSASVQVMVELLLSKEVQGLQAEMWLKSLHFLPKPTEDMVVHAKRLVSSDEHRMASLLPVTSLVSHFCKSNPDCANNDNVRLVSGAIHDILAGGCQSEDQKLVLTALRSVGNLGFADHLVRNLEKCAKNDKLPMHLRVSALQAFRGMTCAITRRTPMEIFLDKGEDSELRIASYLAVMHCPFENVLAKVKQQLEREEVNQVGSFVWTHLTNLKESSMFHKQAVRSILEDEQLQKAFDLDKRKFSRNYELSYFSQDFGLGGSAESNLIWSEKSFVPRSAMLNVTVDILGHTVNLLEVGGRVQGVEGLLQEIIGNSNFFKGGAPASRNSKKASCAKQQKLNRMKQKFEVDEDAMSATVYMRLFGNEFGHRHFNEKELTGIKKGVKFNDIFKNLATGRELSWTQSALFLDSTVQVPTVAGMPLALSVNGTTTMDLRAQGKLDLPKIGLKKMLVKFDVRPSAAVQFSGRMSLGLGSTQVGLKMITTLHTSTALSSSVDLNNGQVLVVEMDMPKRNMDVFNVKSEFFIQHDKEDREMKMNKGKQVSRRSCSSEDMLQAIGYRACTEFSYVRTMDENAPYYPFTGPTTLSLTVNKQDAPRGFKFIGKNIQGKRSVIGLLSLDTPGSKADRALNVGFSVDMDDKAAEFEINSPWTDVLLKGTYTGNDKYRRLTGTLRHDGNEHTILMSYQEEQKEDKTVWTSLIDMQNPEDSILFRGTTTKFTVNSTLEVSKTEISAQTNIDTGLIRMRVKPSVVDLKFKYVNSRGEKSLSASTAFDHDKPYSGTVQMLHTINKRRTVAKLQPTVLITAPKWKVFLLSGQVDYKTNKMLKTDMSITMDKTLKKPLTLESMITKSQRKTDERYRGNVKLNSQFANIRMTGFSTNKNNKKVSSRVKVDYVLPFIKEKRNRKNKLVFNTKFHDRSTKALSKYDITLNCDNKLHPQSSFASNYDLTHKNGLTKVGAIINHGPKGKTKQIRSEVSVNHNVKKNDAVIVYSAFFIYPNKAMEYEIKGKHEHHLKDKPRFETYVTTIYGKGKAAELRVRGTNLSKRGKLDMDGSLELSLPPFTVKGKKIPTRRYTVSTTLKESKAKEYIHTVNLQLPNNSKHSVVTRLTAPTARKPTEFEFNSKLDLDLKEPSSLTLRVANSVKDAVVSGVYLAGIKSHSAEVSYSYHDKSYQTMSWDIVWPERHVKGSLEGGKKGDQKGEKEGRLKLVSYWDADRDESKKIESEIYLNYKEGPEVHSESLFTLTTPFEGHKQYTFETVSTMTKSLLTEERKYVWRNPENEYSYSVSMLLPVTSKRFEVQAEVKTPFDELRRGSMDIAHKWDGSKHLSTTVEAGYNDDEIKTVLLFSNSGNAIRKTLTGSIAITSTLPEISDILLTLDHEDDGHTYGSKGLYRYNGRSYHATMNATYIHVDHQMTTNAKLQIELPSDRPIFITWAHSNTLMYLNSTLELQWRPEYNSKIIVGARGSRAENDYGLDLKTITPGDRRPKEFDLQLRQNMMSDYHGSVYWNLNFMPEMETTVSYTFSNEAFEVFYTGIGKQSKIQTHYGKQPITAIVRTSWRSDPRGPEHVIFFESSFNMNIPFSANAKLTTPWENAQNVNFQVNLKNKTVTEWEIDSLISLGVRRHISANINVNIDGSSLGGKIKTPFEQMRKLDFDWKYKQRKSKHTSEATIEMVPLFSKVTMEHFIAIDGSNIDSRLFLEIPDTEIKSVEVTFDNKELRRGHNTNLFVKYQHDQEIDLKVKSRFNTNKFPDKTKLFIDLSTPFAEFPKLDLKTELEKTSDKWTGFLDLKTQTEPLEELLLTFGHVQGATSSMTDIALSSSSFETVTTGAHFDWGNRASANVTFDAPSVGRTSVGFIQNSDSWTDFHNKFFAEFDNKEIDLEVGLKHQENETRGWLVYSLPFHKYGSVNANVHKLGSDFDDFNVGGFLQLGKFNKPYNMSAQYAFKPEKKYALGTTLETPKTPHMSYLYEIDISEPKSYSSIFYTILGERFQMDMKSTHKMGPNDLYHSSNSMYKFKEKSMRFGSTLKAQWSDNVNTATYVSYTDDKKMTIDFTREFGDVGKKYKEKIDVDVSTPYKGFSNIGVQATFNSHKDGAKHGGKVNVEYSDDKEAELTFDLDTPNKHRAGLSAELALPIKGYKKNTLTYNHVVRQDRFKADAEVVTGKGHRLSSDIDYKDKALTFSVTGPVESFESLAVTAEYNPQNRKITGDASYQLNTTPSPVSLKYNIALKDKPVVLDFELTNVAGKVTNLRIEHDGSQLRNFNNVIDLKSEADQLNNVHIVTFWQLLTPGEFELRSKMTSDHPQYPKAEMKLNSLKRWDEQFSELKLEWYPQKQILISNGFTFDESKEKPSAKITFDVNTPWEELEEISLEFSHRPTDASLHENIVLKHNKKDLLDANFVYTSPNSRHKGVLTFRKPQPMVFSAEGEVAHGMFDGNLKLDWDQNSPVGRVEIVSSFNDKSSGNDLDKEFKFKVNHPVRILGVDFLYKASENEFHSAGLYTWDEARGNTFSYDLGWANRSTRYSRMLEGHAKVGIPQRSVKYQGSYSDTGRAITTTSSFNWHADEDETKKVTMTTSVEENDNLKRVDLNINIPYINKQLNLGAVTKGGYGRNLLDTKAEISYSSDPSKTITVTSLVSNSIPESSGDGYNYTLDVGFRHPVSGIDLTLISHVADVNKVISAGSDFSFLNVNGGRQNVNFFTKMDYPNRRFEIEVGSPVKTLGLQGQTTVAHRGRTLVSASAFEDGKEALKLGMVIDPQRRHLDLEFNYDQDNPNKLLGVSGRFINDSAITLDVTTQATRNSPAQTETLIAMRLNSSQLLHTRILWRPNVDAEIREFLGTKLTDFSYETSDFLKKAVEIVGQEVKGKYILVSEELKSELTPVFDLMEQEMQSLNAQLNTLWVKFRRFHQQNHMHIKDMGDHINKAFGAINDEIALLVRNYWVYYRQVNEATQEWLDHLSSFPIGQAYQGFVNDAGFMLKEVEGALEELLSIVVTQVKQLADEYYREYMKLSRKIDRKLDSYARSVQELPLYRKMVEQRAIFGEKVPAWVHWYDTVYVKSQELLQDQFHDFMARDEFQHMFAVLNEVLGQMKHYNKESTLGTAMHRVSEMTKNLLLIELAKLKKTITDFRKTKVIVYNPEKGELQFEMYLPIPLKSLYEAPELNPQRYVAHAQRLVQSQVEKVSKMLPNSNTSLWDLYYDHVPSTNPTNWVPPYEASAYLIGSQHIVTFDKHEYDFLSKCSHVLARDTLKDRFSAVVNYSRRPKREGIRSICLTIENDHFVISKDYKLIINNQATEMPFTSDKVKVVREGDFIRLQYIHGLEVLCNPKLDLYKFTVSGWYHGHLAGLLGHYDNEMHSDIALAERFGDFEVNKRSCRSTNQALKPRPQADKEGVCLRLFSASNEKFRPCFRQVDPSSFRELCETYVGKMSIEQGARLASEQYRFVCQGQGIFMSAVQEFASCGKNSETFQVRSDEAKFQSADVVFIVEDIKCNQWARTSLPSIVTNMDKVLTRKGFTENRFGLEGYGGVDVDEVSVRTIDGKHFGAASLFLKALETLRFSDSIGSGDLSRALREATDYPFRAGVAKVLVLAPCSKCEVSFLDSTLISTLATNGFQVHVLQEREYGSEGIQVFGTKGGVEGERFFPSDASDFNGVLRQGRKIEQRDGENSDFCQDLADQTGGAIFDTFFLQNKVGAQRQFVKAFSSHVALSTKLPECQDCQCDANTGRTRCNLCGAASPYFNSIPSLPEAVGALYDASHQVKDYFSNTVESARESIPDNYLMLGM